MARMPFRSLPKAVEFDYEALLNPGGKQGFLCLSESTWELAYNLVLAYGEWRSRYYFSDPMTGDKLTITDEEYNNIRQVYQLALEELQMSGCTDLTNAVLAIGQQLVNIDQKLTGLNQDGCCPGGYGDPPAEPAPPQGIPEVDPPPTGFETWTEYNQYKCRAANRITDDMIATVGNMATLSGLAGVIAAAALAAFLSTSLLGGLLVGLMAIGFAAGTAAAIIIGALIALIASGAGLLAYFAALASSMDDDKSDLVCGLFAAATVEAARAEIIDFVDTHAAALMFDPGDDGTLFSEKTAVIIAALANNQVINKLFEADETTGEYVGDVDCEECAESPTVYQVWDTTDSSNVFVAGDVDGENIILESQEVPEFEGFHVVRFSVWQGNPFAFPGNPCQNHRIEFVSSTGDIGGVNGGNLTDCESGLPWIYDDGYETLIPGEFCAMFGILFGTGPFTVTIRVEPLVHEWHNETDLSEWDTVENPVNTSIASEAEAAMNGTSGGLLITTAGSAVYVESEFAEFAGAQQEIEFWIDTNLMALDPGEFFNVARLFGSGFSSAARFRVGEGVDNTHEIEFLANTDDGASSTAFYDIPQGQENHIKGVVVRATSAVASDGVMQLWVNASMVEEITGLDIFDVANWEAIRVGVTDPTGGPNGEIWIDEITVTDVC